MGSAESAGGVGRAGECGSGGNGSVRGECGSVRRVRRFHVNLGKGQVVCIGMRRRFNIFHTRSTPAGVASSTASNGRAQCTCYPVRWGSPASESVTTTADFDDSGCAAVNSAAVGLNERRDVIEFVSGLDRLSRRPADRSARDASHLSAA